MRWGRLVLALLSFGCRETPTEPRQKEVDLGALQDLAQRFDLAQPIRDLTITGTRITVATGNLTSGPSQLYEDSGIRLLHALHADIALVQELNYKTNSIADLREFVDRAFGTDYQLVRESENDDSIPNGIVSRFPILQSGEWSDVPAATRDFVWARIDIPGDRDLLVVSVHLLTDDSKRPAEAQTLIDYIKQEYRMTDYLVVGGDFNSDSRTEAALTALDALLEVSGPLPVDTNGNSATNSSRSGNNPKPYDWVLASGQLHRREVPVLVGDRAFDHGFVLDSRTYTPLSDVAPLEPTDSAGLNMQHMGVVRAFAVEN